jgi:hypothetical protein
MTSVWWGPAFNVPTGEGKQHHATYQNSLLESEWVLFDTVDAVLKKTDTHPSQVSRWDGTCTSNMRLHAQYCMSL